MDMVLSMMGPAPSLVPGPYCFGGDVAVCQGLPAAARGTCGAVMNGLCLTAGLLAAVLVAALGLWMVVSG